MLSGSMHWAQSISSFIIIRWSVVLLKDSGMILLDIKSSTQYTFHSTCRKEHLKNRSKINKIDIITKTLKGGYNESERYKLQSG